MTSSPIKKVSRFMALRQSGGAFVCLMVSVI